MALKTELSRWFVEWRLDALGLAVLTIIGLVRARGLLPKISSGTGEWLRKSCLVGGILLVGAVLAEAATFLLDDDANVSFASLLTLRLVLIGETATAGLLLYLAFRQRRRLRRSEQAREATEAQLLLTASSEAGAERLRDDFLSVAEQELRLPLQAVRAGAHGLGANPLDPQQREQVEAILAQASRMEGVLQDLVDYARLEQGRLRLEPRPFAPLEVLQACVAQQRGAGAARAATVRLAVDELTEVLVWGDRHRFSQVTAKLLENALSFSSGQVVEIAASWTGPKYAHATGELRLRVKDSRPRGDARGETELLPAFAPGRGPRGATPGQPGLSLGLVYRLVRLMDGEISVDGDSPGGVEFLVVLPLRPAARSELPPSPLARDPRSRGPRVLVVDDLETNRLLLELFLQRHGFQTEIAEGGEAAIRRAARGGLDVILMDLHMPETDGLAATRRIREAEPPGQRVPIFALTASLARGTREQCLAAGMDEHLTKPLDIERFRTLLSPFLPGQRR
ncbi:MAG: hybrid sensor histidine kinase/response regulator [Opitutaceae bacterium]